MRASETTDLEATLTAHLQATAAREARQNRGWERRGERLRRRALAADPDPALLALCHADRALYHDLLHGGTDWAAEARGAAEEKAAEKALLPRFRRLLAGTAAEVWVSEDGPHADADGREYAGFFVSLRVPGSAWVLLEPRLRDAGFSWLNVVDADEEPLTVDVVDAWVGACPLGCGQCSQNPELHAARCGRGREGPQEPPQDAAGAGARGEL